MLTARHGYPWFFILIALCLVSACAAHDMEGRPLDLSQSREGYFKDGVYHNDFYHFTWKAPQGWKPVKPTPLEALISRPEPNRGYMFGWANPAQQAEIRLLVYPPPQGAACAPQALAANMARDQGWRALSEQPGQWQGRPAMQIQYAPSTGLGQVSQTSALARFVCMNQELLVFQLQMPGTDYNAMHNLFQELVRQVQFAKTPEQLAREAKPAPAPDLVHTVKSGAETLAAIAQWYTGNPTLAGRLQALNRIPEPVRLSVGQQIKIPLDLVTNHQPMPAAPVRKKATGKAGKRDEPAESGEAAVPAATTVPAPAPAPAPPAPAPTSEFTPSAGGLQLEPIGPR